MDLPNDPTAIILDPHPLWIEAVERVLDRIGVRTAAKATTPEVAFELVHHHRPGLLIAELASSGERLGGLACIQRIHDLLPEVRVVVLSTFSDQPSVQVALAAGAAAYVFKTAQPDDLATAVRQAFDSSIYLLEARRSPFAEGARERPALTKREAEILGLTAQGLPNSELARILLVTEQTIKFHLSNVYRKLGVSNRMDASRWAQANGLLEAPQEASPPDAWRRTKVLGAGPVT